MHPTDFIRIDIRTDESHVSTTGDTSVRWDSYTTTREEIESVTAVIIDGSKWMEWDGPQGAPESGSWIYVVIERYTDGGTFGQTTGMADSKGWYLTPDDATARIKELKKTISSRMFYKHESFEMKCIQVQPKIP